MGKISWPPTASTGVPASGSPWLLRQLRGDAVDDLTGLSGRVSITAHNGLHNGDRQEPPSGRSAARLLASVAASGPLSG